MKKGTHFHWTTEHLRWIAANMDKTDAEMAAHIGTNLFRLRGFRKRQGLLKEHAGRIQPGNVPHNKGKRAPWAKNGACKRGHFKKGGTPHNTRKVGDRWQRKENGYTYWRIKTTSGIEYLHRYLWAEVHGPIPPKHKVQFIDGNCGNVTIENLRCVSMIDAMREAAAKSDYTARARKIWKTRRLNIAKEVSKPFTIAA
ncbi:MAG: HNH endonuclease [Flavobacteriales bacterium]|nr:HNH endonuclease [Flavobacteriales bacterium]